MLSVCYNILNIILLDLNRNAFDSKSFACHWIIHYKEKQELYKSYFVTGTAWDVPCIDS